MRDDTALPHSHQPESVQDRMGLQDGEGDQEDDEPDRIGESSISEILIRNERRFPEELVDPIRGRGRWEKWRLQSLPGRWGIRHPHPNTNSDHRDLPSITRFSLDKHHVPCGSETRVNCSKI